MNRLSTFAALKGYQLWDVNIGNNYYTGRYAEFGYRPYPVIAASNEEVEKTVLKYADQILEDLKTKKYSSKRRMVPPSSALKITKSRLGRVERRVIRSTTDSKWKKIISPLGWVEVQLEHSVITGWRSMDEA
jgi:hypothetical protein